MNKYYLKNVLKVFLFVLCPMTCFKFSVIIAIYNTGRYLNDSIGSLLNQTIGFENIQVILINDGSTDNSEEICLMYHKKYYKNIIYVRIEHGGVSRARNVGLKYANGTYINFLDADDKWESEAFRHVLIFFNMNKKVKIAAGRLLFFEAINSYHPLDYKFYKTRVVNLTEEYNCPHLSGPSTFFKYEIIKGKKFVENVFSGEDTILINNLLLLSPIMGIIREAIYYYRRRADYSSAVQTQGQKVDFYFSQIKSVGQYLIDKSKELYNKIVPFIQFYIGYNVLFRIISPAFKILSKDMFNEYCHIIESQLRQIEDKYILEQKFTSYKIKFLALSKKYNRDVRYEAVLIKEVLIYSGYAMMNLKYCNYIIVWRFLEIEGNFLHLEGKDDFWMPREKYFYYCKCGNKTFYPRYYDYSGYDFITMYGLIQKGRIVKFDIPIQQINEQIIQFYISYSKNNIEIFPSFGAYTHITAIKNGYYSQGNYIIKIIKRRINIYKYNERLEQTLENQYCIQLKNIKKENIIELRKSHIKSRDSNKTINNKIWIINDRKDRAGDNGEYFFRYLMKRKPKGKDIFFAIEKKSNDYLRLKEFNNILDFGSNQYFIYFLKADKIITSVSDSWAINPFGDDQKYIRDLFHFDVIFLQNGIIKDDLSSNLNRINKNFSLFITSSKKEYKSILSSKYFYNRNNIILTGLSRFDNLLEIKNIYHQEKLLLIIPTWRTYIKGTRDLVTSKAVYSDGFKNTTFFNFYNNFINDQKLILYLTKYNYTGILCLHPNFSEQNKDFTQNLYFSVNGLCNFQELLAKASLLITDYSSIFFDFAYLKKPIIYTQFDIEDYRRYHFPEGYFNYNKDGFGPVCYDLECTINEIIKQIENNCQLKNKYINRINRFFIFFDKNNNNRIYNGIIKNLEKTEEYFNGFEIYFFFITSIFILFIMKIKLIIKI